MSGKALAAGVVEWMFAAKNRRLAPCRSVTPDAGEGGGDLLLETLDQFAVRGDQTLLAFDLRHDGGGIANYELEITNWDLVYLLWISGSHQ